MVRLQYQKRYICAATVISNYKILTAGHCVYNKTSLTLIFGSVDLDKPYHKVDINEQNIILHPEYSKGPPSFQDIAVIELEKKLTFDSNIDKIEMVDKFYVPKMGDEVTMLGYTEATTHPVRKIIDRSHLRSVVSTIGDFNKCAELYSKRMQNLHLDENRQFCVNLRKNNTHNTNNGDSGGPVTSKDGKFIGIASFNFNGFPEVYVFISAFYDFISNPRLYVLNHHQKWRIGSDSSKKSTLKRVLSSS